MSKAKPRKMADWQSRFDCTKLDSKDYYGKPLFCCKEDCRDQWEIHCQHCERFPI